MYSAHPKDWEAGGTEAGEEEGSYPAMYIRAVDYRDTERGPFVPPLEETQRGYRG